MVLDGVVVRSFPIVVVVELSPIGLLVELSPIGVVVESFPTKVIDWGYPTSKIFILRFTIILSIRFANWTWQACCQQKIRCFQR